MASHFIVKGITDLKNVDNTATLQESDFSLLTSDDKFIQFQLVEENKTEEKYKVSAGIYVIATKEHKFILSSSSFTKEKVLDDYLNTKDISDKINKFFSKLHVYHDLGIFPKRAALLYGRPGCGKSALLTKLATEYSAQGDTTVIIWPTDKFEARHVKDFLRTFEYSSEIKKLILILEDLGGGETEGRGKMVSDSSLLALLDNVEKTFVLPTMILATTNFPENFLENLTDRPQRFDDVIEVPLPAASFRAKFLEFFANGKIEINQDLKDLIMRKEFDTFSIAHIKETVVRSLIYDISLKESIEQVKAQSVKAQADFTTRKKMGF